MRPRRTPPGGSRPAERAPAHGRAHPNPAAIRLHADVAQAVQAGEAEAAEQAMREIIREAAQALLDQHGGRTDAHE